MQLLGSTIPQFFDRKIVEFEMKKMIVRTYLKCLKEVGYNEKKQSYLRSLSPVYNQ